MGRTIRLEQKPLRIISLVPSQTELLIDLGLEDRLVGITKFCIHPAENLKKFVKVGGTKQYHFDRIEALRPDLIIGNKEENEKEQIERLAELYPVWMSDICTLSDAYDMITMIGDMLDRKEAANELVENVKLSFASIPKTINPPKIAYFIWQNPFMVAAKGTFIDVMLELSGFDNVFKHLDRYPEISLDDDSLTDIDAVFLSSEPYPFKEKHMNVFRKSIPNAEVMLVDGELFSWYGSRLLKAGVYFKELQLHLQKTKR